MITVTDLLNEMAYTVGRLEGLSGTLRYELSDECREELKEIAMRLRDKMEVAIVLKEIP